MRLAIATDGYRGQGGLVQGGTVAVEYGKIEALLEDIIIAEAEPEVLTLSDDEIELLRETEMELSDDDISVSG